jgi:anti-sigma factor RsiW
VTNSDREDRWLLLHAALDGELDAEGAIELDCALAADPNLKVEYARGSWPCDRRSMRRRRARARRKPCARASSRRRRAARQRFALPRLGGASLSGPPSAPSWRRSRRRSSSLQL